MSVELARCRLRPVLGRLPLLVGAAGAIVGVVVARSGGPLTAADLVGAVSVASTPVLLVAVTVGAGLAHDLRTSGIDLTDRALVGRPLALSLAQSAALATWSAAVGATLGGGLVAARLAATGARGGSLPAPGDLAPVLAGVAQLAAAAAATAAVGFALARASRSPTVAVGGFLVVLLLGDGLLVALDPALAALALPDNLLALGAGRLEGLAVRGEPFRTSAVRAVLGATVVVVAAAARDARRDAG